MKQKETDRKKRRRKKRVPPANVKRKNIYIKHSRSSGEAVSKRPEFRVNEDISPETPTEQTDEPFGIFLI